MNLTETLETRRREALSRLAARSQNFTAEPDVLVPGAWLVRNRHISGRANLVTAAGECSCCYGRTFGICRHIAVAEQAKQEGNFHQ